ncbi:Cna B-type domain-containing protein [uncultured Granulicatella sp.]|jgi:LPXTG-motif cell wall-anchored protein|uniref:Cna B-type domain-containing protein n=1 Tax=uncultured Granulicatella sp. TaxID=316089 RepID=UPI002639ACD7|nr:Cna B-type domain-containing protein [uncultured Granulicatella sp.]
MNKKVQRKSVITFFLSIVAMITMALLGGKTTAQEAGGSELSLDNVRVTSFKIIDISKANKEIDYKTADNAQYEEFKNDPSKFNNVFCEGQTDSKFKLQLSISYSSQNALKEGDKLVIPASLERDKTDFSKKPLLDGTNHELGTWEYKDGNIVIYFSGDYIKNNRVTQFTASFETGEMGVYISVRPKTTKLGERRSEFGTIGKQKFVLGVERPYVVASKINDTRSGFSKSAPPGNDSNISWHLVLASDDFRKTIDGTSYLFYNPYLLENNGAYSPKALTDIYVEDTVDGVIEKPRNLIVNVRLSGMDDEGKVVAKGVAITLGDSKLKRVDQENKTRDEVKASLNKGEYCIYDNKDGSYTLMLKWWDMNDPNGLTYDDIPAIKDAGGVGNYLKNVEPDIFGAFKPETIEKNNDIFKGKAVQNVFLNFQTKHVPIKERTEVSNTAKFESRQTGPVDRNAIGILTPSAGIADAPADPLSVKLLKSDAKTGQNLSDGFKFELQTTNDNGTTWERVAVTQEMLVEGTLNGDTTLSPNANGTIEVKGLTGGKKYRFLEKAHPEEYENVHEDSNNPNTIKNPKSSNSRVVEISNQGTGKVVVMYNQPKPEKVEIKVVKNWVGPEKEQVTVKLLADGQDTGKTLELNRQQNWMGSFTNLDSVKDDGTEIHYSIEELTIAGYQSVITGDAKTGFTITNTNVEKISIEGTKTWDDNNNQDGKRPTQITINLLKNGVKVSSKNVTAADGWKWKFENLDKYENGNENTYTVTEERVDGYSTEVNGYNVKNTYTPGKTSIQVTKAWDDNNDKDNKRPTSVTIKLLADGRETGNTLVLTKENRWAGNFTGLDEYKDGKKIVYTIKEELLGNDYKSVITGNEQDGFVVTNVRATDTTNKTPKTGDRSNLVLYVGLLALSATILLVLARKKGSIKKHVK